MGQQYQVPHATSPTQQYQPPDQAQRQQPTPYFRPYAGAGPVPNQQPQQYPSASASQPSGSRKQQKQPSRPNGQQESAPAGPGAPGPDSNSPNLEEQLRDALQRENNSQGENESNRIDHDDEEDDDDDDGDGNANPRDTNEPIFNIPPPPEGNYAGEQELEKSLHAWSLEHGYEMVRRASKKNANGVIYKRYYHCSKHGKLANTGKLTDETRQRSRRKSNRIGCPMSLAAVSVDPSNPAGEWQIRHRKTHHNHGPMEAVTLTGHRRRARMGGVEKAVDGLFAIGTPTAQILTFLQRTNPDGLFTRTDVANMKLKWKKYGTCQHLPNQYSKDPAKTMGMPSACLACRAKKTRCDSQRPTCANCVQKGIQCEYNHEPAQSSANPQSPSASSPPQPNHPTADLSTATRTTARSGRRGVTTLAQNREEASQILADLQQYQMEHIKPKRLELNSSSVEILAQSSCGNGDSYRRVPTLYLTGDWQSYADEFLEASLKENTYDVLLGIKAEPPRPDGRTPGDGSLNTGHRGPAGGTEDEIDVEVWNEYVKQVAIFNRRNQALLGAMWGSLSPSFRTRINGFKKASEAWAALEEMCCPRGSEQAWKLYSELYGITLASTPTKNVSDYASRLETKYAEFCRLKISTQHPHDRLGRYHPNMASKSSAVGGPATAAEIVPEEALCMLFLKGLGEEWKKWVDSLCQTSNVGGFGTGFKLGLRDLVKKAVEIEGSWKEADASSMT